MSSSSATRTIERSLPSSLDSYHDLVQQILDELAELGWRKQDLFGVNMALEETMSNAIRHGNKEDPAKQVHVKCRMSPLVFWVQISDEGQGFAPAEVPDCCAAENLEVPGGRGLALVRA